MNSKQKMTNNIRRYCTIFLLLVVLVQLITIVLMEVGIHSHAIFEIHELCGYLMFIFVLIHVVLFRKSLMQMIKPKSTN